MAIGDNTSYELTGAQVKDLANKIKAKAADNIFVGATSAAPGSKGLVPQPQAGDDSKFLKGDGTWGSAPSNFVTLDTDQTITGKKTLQGVTNIQNGQGTGSLWIGGDVNASGATDSTRHLARIVAPSYADASLGATMLGFDTSGDSDMHVANKATDALSFGGMKKITNATSPMAIGFCVANTRGATAAASKVYPLEMDASEARFNVRPNYNGTNLATVSELPALTSGTATVNTAYLSGTARWRKFGKIVLVDYSGGITTAPPGQARVQIISGLPTAATSPNSGTSGSFTGSDYGAPTRVYDIIIEAGATTLNLVWPPAITSREANFQFIYMAE